MVAARAASGEEGNRCASRITRGDDDSRCRYVTTISANNGRNSTLRGGGRGIKEGDVLIRQNPILFIGPFDQIAREIVRGD